MRQLPLGCLLDAAWPLTSRVPRPAAAQDKRRSTHLKVCALAPPADMPEPDRARVRPVTIVHYDGLEAPTVIGVAGAPPSSAASCNHVAEPPCASRRPPVHCHCSTHCAHDVRPLVAVDKSAKAEELIAGAKAWLGAKLKPGETLRLCKVRCWRRVQGLGSRRCTC